MKKAIHLAIFIGIISVTFLTTCKKESSPGTEFTIQIDSILHPDTIAVGAALEINFYGTVGTTDCFSFDKFDIQFADSLINATALGLYTESENCAEKIISLNGESVKIYELPEGNFTIVVNQPRGNTMESKVHVVP